MSNLTAADAFAAFVMRTLVPAKARRLGALASSRKGQQRILDSLGHEFEPAIQKEVIRTRNYSSVWEQPCYVFHARMGFGAEFPNVQQAYDELATEDSWLIVLRDASAGIHRPETRWDDEKLIA